MIKKCIVTLSQTSKLKELGELIENLNTYFVKNNKNVDLIIFVEEKDKNSFSNMFDYNGGKTIIKIIKNFELLNNNYNKEIPEYVHSFPVSYRMMCQFFSGEIFKILKTMDYEYYLRLDTDSRFMDHVYDVFSEFISADFQYGYITILNEPPELCYGMSDEIKKYIIKNNIKCEEYILLDHINQMNFVYYNNFEVVKISEFVSDTHLNLYSYLNDDINGFLKYRWGDALFRFMYVNLFIKQEKIKYFNDIDYYHNGNFKNKPFMLNNWNLNEFRKCRLNAL